MKAISFEGLSCYTFKSIVNHSDLSKSKCLILEASPDPDYYAQHHFPPNKPSNKRHLFLPVKKDISCFQDSVIRSVVRIREKVNQHLHIFPGQITFENKSHQCIHMQLADLTRLDMLLEELKDRKIKFVSDKNVKPYESTMIFKKHTRYVELMEGVFQDADNEHRYFFKIPNHIEFEVFEKGIEEIKGNCQFHLFDTFLSHYFVNDTVMDFIGVYSKHCEKDRFGELQANIKHVFTNS